jgi:hypothetical protein
VSRTSESIAEEEAFTRLVPAIPVLRARVVLDPEGWPTVPARYGRLEWRGVDATGPHKGRPGSTLNRPEPHSLQAHGGPRHPALPGRGRRGGSS